MANEFKQIGPNDFESQLHGRIQKRTKGRKALAKIEYWIFPDLVAPAKPWEWYGPYATAKEAEAALMFDTFVLTKRFSK
jgi:hypothetical protein